MKVSQDKSFCPVNITIESQDELNWILACLNIPENVAVEAWENLGYDKEKLKLDHEMQLQIFNAVESLF